MAMQIGQTGGASDEQERADGEVWRELVQGNLAALDVLYDRHAGLALGLACRMLGDRQGAEDVVQESFLQAWRRADRYDPSRGSLRCWLLAIVRHRCVDVLRRQAVRPRTTSWEADSLDRSAGEDTWNQVERLLTHATLRRALLHLSPEQREAIELGFFGGYTHAEIAERLGLPLGTVKGRFRLGLQRLRTVLQGLDESHAVTGGAQQGATRR
jgi:RNA polymerase sigma-70 factor (ECF subfamily)